jgi:hypothetical protein
MANNIVSPALKRTQEKTEAVFGLVTDVLLSRKRLSEAVDDFKNKIYKINRKEKHDRVRQY